MNDLGPIGEDPLVCDLRIYIRNINMEQQEGYFSL